jgi:rubrerythrin
MAQHRTIAERKQALEAQLARLLQKEAEEAHANHPAMQALKTRLQNVTSDNLKFQRWENEWEEKVANFEQRAQEWRGRGEQAKNMMSIARRQKARIERFMADASERIANGEDVSADDYSISNNPDEYED